ncbi:hypothetical protein M422DRAFT_28279, partial [Sphaerobolus stellatus SS14]
MLFKFVLTLAVFVSVASALEIMLFESQSGDADASNCMAGGTTVSGTGSTCIQGLASIISRVHRSSVTPKGVLVSCYYASELCRSQHSDTVLSPVEMWDGTNCSGIQNNGQGANFCFNALHPI